MSHGGHVDSSNKKVALVIAVLAAALAFSETLGKSAQTNGLASHIEASNLWAFFQAKTIRLTTLRTAAEALEVDVARTQDAKAKEAMEKRVAEWRKTAARYESEPETNEGRKELAARAKWREWARYMKATFCSRCGEPRYCGARYARGPWLCVDCHDLEGPQRELRRVGDDEGEAA